MTFSMKRLRATFIRAEGNFAGSNGNTIDYDGLRMSAVISDSNGLYDGLLDLLIWGLKPADMADLFYIRGSPLSVRPQDRIQLWAGEGTKLSIAYNGQVVTAGPDYSAMPDVPFHVTGQVGVALALRPVAAVSFAGGVAIEQIMATLAGSCGLYLQNNGVSGPQLTDQTFRGAALEQIDRAAKASGIEYKVEGTNLIIWPRGGARTLEVPVIGPGTGLVGYPERTPTGVNFRCEYSPLVKGGGLVDLETSALTPQTAGRWRMLLITHHLEAEVPQGAWFSDVQAFVVNP
jgi:hypothetical protein